MRTCRAWFSAGGLGPGALRGVDVAGPCSVPARPSGIRQIRMINVVVLDPEQHRSEGLAHALGRGGAASRVARNSSTAATGILQSRPMWIVRISPEAMSS